MGGHAVLAGNTFKFTPHTEGETLWETWCKQHQITSWKDIGDPDPYDKAGRMFMLATNENECFLLRWAVHCWGGREIVYGRTSPKAEGRRPVEAPRADPDIGRDGIHDPLDAAGVDRGY